MKHKMVISHFLLTWSGECSISYPQLCSPAHDVLLDVLLLTLHLTSCSIFLSPAGLVCPASHLVNTQHWLLSTASWLSDCSVRPNLKIKIYNHHYLNDFHTFYVENKSSSSASQHSLLAWQRICIFATSHTEAAEAKIGWAKIANWLNYIGAGAHCNNTRSERNWREVTLLKLTPSASHGNTIYPTHANTAPSQAKQDQPSLYQDHSSHVVGTNSISKLINLSWARS